VLGLGAETGTAQTAVKGALITCGVSQNFSNPDDRQLDQDR
jgi:hypothetical protein